MGTYTAQWEDEENNRILGLHVQYQMDGIALEIERVTPAFVTFLDASSRQPIRTIGVHTRAGQRLLMRKFEERVSLGQLRQELATTLALPA